MLTCYQAKTSGQKRSRKTDTNVKWFCLQEHLSFADKPYAPLVKRLSDVISSVTLATNVRYFAVPARNGFFDVTTTPVKIYDSRALRCLVLSC